MKYPKEYLNEIKLRLKVSQVVGKTVKLKRRGKEFIGLSPFKNEKTPSFTVSDEKEFYHCFSTGEHGNIFDFIMKTKSIGFGEAVKELANEAGLPKYKFSIFDEKKEKKYSVYKKIYNFYLNFFHQEIFKKNNQEALNYLQKRGFNKNIIEEYKLGYVPWKNDFYQSLIKNFNEEEIFSTGLYYKHDQTGKFIDRFNSRIIFPINNLTGETIAFGGRVIKESKFAKYINSPETEFYKKGNMIFNLDKAKLYRAETKEVIIVEGYMDVVSLHSAGIKNVISNSGTALTENQIKLIWKFFNNPIICLDGDNSGQAAALRIAEKMFPIINENNKIYFSIMPNGQDPDDFIKNKGTKEFQKLLLKKKIIQTYIWDSYILNLPKNNPFQISKFEKKIKNLCYQIKDETLKKYILEEFLEKIRIFTPIQNNRVNYKNYSIKNVAILNETKKIHFSKNHLTKEKLKELAVLFIMINFNSVTQLKIEELSELTFSSEESNNLKDEILNKLSKDEDKTNLLIELEIKFKNLIREVEDNTVLRDLMAKKDKEGRLELLDELLFDLKEMKKLKEIEFLENKLTKNMDESSFSELVRLKNQLNSD